MVYKREYALEVEKDVGRLLERLGYTDVVRVDTDHDLVATDPNGDPVLIEVKCARLSVTNATAGRRGSRSRGSWRFYRPTARTMARRSNAWYVLVLLVQDEPAAVFLASSSWVWSRIGKGNGDWGALSVLAVDDSHGRIRPPFVRRLWPTWNQGRVGA